MAPKVNVQPGFMTPGDDVMALVAEVGNSLKAILKNEEAMGKPLAKSNGSETVATSDGQTIKEGGAKGSGEHVATSDPQTINKGETSSSGGGMLPTKMTKASPSAGDEGSPPSAGGSPSADAGGPPMEGSASAGMPGEGDPSGAPPAEGAPPDAQAQAPAAGPSFEELVQMYSQLPPEDLQAHMMAIEQAAQGAAGGAPGGAPGMGAPPDAGMPPGGGGGMPPSAPPSPGMGAPPSAPPSPGMPPMGKSESYFAAELKKTQDDLGKVTEALTAVLTMPKRKAINGLNIIPYQGDLKKSEPTARPDFATLKANPAALHAELKKMTMPDSELSKKERDLVTDFYCRRIGVDDLSVIFTEKK